MTTRDRADHHHATVIEPPRGILALDFHELWQYRELLFLFVWRDATIRYKQSVVGIGWALIQPVLMMAIFTLVFGRFARLPSDGVPYPVFSLCALIPWNYFARSLADSSNSLVGGSQLVTKIYFPRLILPLSKVFSGLIDFAIAFALLAVLMLWYRITPSPGLLLLPLFILVVIVTALALGLWLTALNVKYRDVSFVVPFLIQIWMYASPVAYSSSIVPARWRTLYALNPMVGVVDGFRWALLGKKAPDPATMAVSFTIMLLLLVSGLYYFRRMEQTFADNI
ncbi:MAG TPA: ABC transporter permease [Thermoanaerobaculia bacterium]|jgi:lipopolysaccharide transport system permease protein